jgi:hypothetical protein
MKATPKLKLSTITGPFTGSSPTLPLGEVGMVWAQVFKQKETFIKPFTSSLLLLKSAGPNYKVSILGAPSDAYAFSRDQSLYDSYMFISDYFNSSLGSLLTHEIQVVKDLHIQKLDVPLGKLSIKEEAAGKLRVFAITDVWTQSLLNQIHHAVFDILLSIPQDGTMNQALPISNLMDTLREREDKQVFSFDLSAATDRLPIDIQVQVLSQLYSYELACNWKNLLVGRDWILREKYSEQYQLESINNVDIRKTGITHRLRYSVGQPMGALSSWAMLALTHHFIVQCSARRAGYTSWFSDYALLGDDIVIANKAVADHYLSIMSDLGVEINLSKTISSNKGCIEFAKRLVSPTSEISPLGPKNILWSVKTKAMIPTLFLDYLGKGVSLNLDAIEKIFANVPFPLTKKNTEALIWMICGPFGFIKDTERFAPNSVARSMYHDNPKEFMRNLLTTLLYYQKKEWFLAICKTATSIVDLYESSVPYFGNLSVLDVPSRQELFIQATIKSRELFEKNPAKVLNLSPYQYVEESGRRRTEILNLVISGKVDYSPVTNCLVSPPIVRPKLRFLTTDFFKKMNMLEAKHRVNYWGPWSKGINI